MKKKLLLGGLNLSGTGVINLVISFISNVILARLLLPSDFGTFYFIASTLGIIYSFLGFNLHLNIIQKDKVNREFLGTIYFLSILIGIFQIIISILMYIFYENLRNINFSFFYILVISLNTFILNLSSLIIAIDERNLEYSRVAVYELVSNNLPHILSILLAFIFPGAWILFFREFMKSLIRLFLSWKFIKPKIRLKFNYIYFKEIFSYTKHIYVSQFLESISHKVDKWFIGNFFGKAELGFYSMAYRLSFLGHQVLEPFAVRFSLGIISRNKNNPKIDFYSFFLILILLFIFSIFSLVLFLFGKQLISFLYGEKWLFTYNYLMAFIPFIIFLTPLDHLRAYFFAIGKPKIITKMRFIYILIVIFGFFITYIFHISGICVAIILSLANFIGFIFLLVFTNYKFIYKLFTIFLTILIVSVWNIKIGGFVCG